MKHQRMVVVVGRGKEEGGRGEEERGGRGGRGNRMRREM